MSAADATLLPRALDWMAKGRKVALATVIETWGSAPQPVGSQLLIDADGNFEGSVSGGCVEGAVITEAQEVIASGKLSGHRVARMRHLLCAGRKRGHQRHLPPGGDVGIQLFKVRL